MKDYALLGLFLAVVGELILICAVYAKLSKVFLIHSHVIEKILNILKGVIMDDEQDE